MNPGKRAGTIGDTLYFIEKPPVRPESSSVEYANLKLHCGGETALPNNLRRGPMPSCLPRAKMAFSHLSVVNALISGD
jgi:hypothetical protein